MKNIFRINSLQVYNLWRNTAYGLMTMALIILLTTLLPCYLAPVVSTIAALTMYIFAYTGNNRKQSCILHISAVFISILSYTFLLILLNLASTWIASFDVWFELTFFADTFIPVLLLAPVTLVTCIFLLLRGNSSSVCTDCMLINGNYRTRGRIGIILHHESKVQLSNLAVVFGVITAISYLYYLYVYNSTNITSRDTFVFCWLPIILLIGDVIFFAIRYYNLFLDLRERNQIVTPRELSEMNVTTWVRYYVICEDSVYLNMHAPDELKEADTDTVIETPFIVNRETSSITDDEAAAIIRQLTGVRDGKLRFFFGRRSPDNFKHSVIRYFYFLPGELERYPELKDVEGTWISSNKFKTLFYNAGVRFSPLLNTDMTRLATIIITSKTFNERGERRTKLKQYHPSFNFEELYHSDIDFQDNSWLRVSCFNSDMPHYRIKRMWRNITRRHNIPVDD